MPRHWEPVIMKAESFFTCQLHPGAGMTAELKIAYPETLPDVLQQPRAQFEREARMAMAVKLFEMRRIPSGIAAELAGMDRVSFLMRLQDYGVPMIDLEVEELESDLRNA